MDVCPTPRRRIRKYYPPETFHQACPISTLRQTCSPHNIHFRFKIQVTLGALPSISPSVSGTCADGDGASLTLLAGVVRTDVSE